MESNELAEGALLAIRQLLDSGNIPRGTFADDQVRNLVALYNKRGAALIKARDALQLCRPEHVTRPAIKAINEVLS